MPAAKHDLVIEQGSTFQTVITYKDSNNDIVDLTGYTARMQIRRRKTTDTPYLSISSDSEIVVGDAAGTLTITIPAATTAALDFKRAVYDLEVESAGGIVTRLLQGTVELNKEVTR